jgi:hypothetical protein
MKRIIKHLQPVNPIDLAKYRKWAIKITAQAGESIAPVIGAAVMLGYLLVIIHSL